MYATSDLIASAGSLFPNAGIFPIPLVMTSVSSASDFPCTSGALKSLAFSVLPDGEEPLPSAAWHSTQLVLYTLAVSPSALTRDGRARAAKKMAIPVAATRRQIRRMFSPLVEVAGLPEKIRPCIPELRMLCSHRIFEFIAFAHQKTNRASR